MDFLLIVLQVLAGAFILVVGVAAAALTVLYVVDVTQKKHAIRRNYPVIGRFRYVFEHLGEFFRQYFFAMDREELPFNRAQRGWAYRAAKNVDNTVAFGSTRDIRQPGTIIFANCAFPALDHDEAVPEPLLFGPDCRTPYHARTFFHISGMSYGAISRPAVRALSRGAKLAGCWMNTGEGGLSPYHLEGGADIVFQIGTAKNGVRDLDGALSDDRLRDIAGHEQVRMFEVKLAQGAKPGKGGILPGAKVTEEIARIRGVRVGQDAISPNRHADIASVDQLLDFIAHVRQVTGKPTGFKCVLGDTAWLDDLCAAVVRRGLASAPDFITLDSADGGTGAAPMPLIDAMGMPIREALPLLVDALCAHGLRERIRVVASGKLITPSEVAWALAVGADCIVSARGFMFALGCIQALQCNRNTCPTGITTHDARLQRGLVVEEKCQRVASYQRNMVKEVGIIAHSCGVADPRDLRRHHARVVTDSGRSLRLDEVYPDVQPPPRRAASA